MFTINGKLLKSLAEIDSQAKLVVVGHSFQFIGFSKANLLYSEVLEIIEEAFILKDSEIFITSPRKKGILPQENLMDQKKSFLLKFKEKSGTTKIIKSVKKHPAYKGDKFKYMKVLKEKLGETSARLDRSLPKLEHKTMKHLMDKYELSQSILYKIHAQYKTLLLMSVAQNPLHNPKLGINNSTLIQSLRKGDPKEDGLVEKLIYTIDNDSKGYLSWEEFLQAMSVIYFGSVSQQIDMIFKMYDSDLSGTLSYDEIKELCKQQLKTSKEDYIANYLSESFAKIIFHLACVPIDKALSAEELKKILKDKDQSSIIQLFCTFDL